MTTALVGGLVIGVIYGLLACSVVFIFRASGVINLAQGDIGMVAAFAFFALSVEGSTPTLVGVLGALIVGGAVGWLMNQVIVRPLQERGPGTTLVATLATATILQLSIVSIWGNSGDFFPPWFASWDGVSIGGVTLRGTQVLSIVIAALVAGVGAAIYRRSNVGLQLRAVSESVERSILVGIRVPRVTAGAWIIGGMVSAAAALLTAPLVPFQPTFMFLLMTKALAAALLAGFTSFVGAMTVAMAIGVIESLSNYYLNIAGISDMVLLVCVVVGLLVRPSANLRGALA